MSRNYKYKSDKRTYHNSTAIVIAVVTAILALAIVIIGVGSSWFTNPVIKTWFGATKQEQPLPDEGKNPEADNSTGGMDIADGSVTESGIKLYHRAISKASYEEEGISPLAESAQQLTATLTPADADNKLVDWAVVFVNPSSTWANGKTVTDYVTVTPTSDGALTANVECKQAFGAQIKITVTSRANSKATASCTVDYRRKLNYTDFVATCTSSSASTLTLNHSTSSTVSWNWLTYSGDEAIFSDWDNYTNTFTDNFGSVYTVDDTVASHNVVVSAHSTLQSKVDAFTGLNYSNDKPLCKKSYTYNGSYGAQVFSQASIIGSRANDEEGLLRCLVNITDHDGDYDYMSEDNYGLMKGALRACEIDFVITVTTTLQSGAKFEKSFNVNVADDSLVTVANSASFDKTTLIF